MTPEITMPAKTKTAAKPAAPSARRVEPEAVAPPAPSAAPHRRMTTEESMLLRIEYGKRLRAARIEAGWDNVTEAAAKSGIGRVMLTQLESGRSSPSMATLDILVHALNLDPRLLFLGPDFRIATPTRP